MRITMTCFSCLLAYRRISMATVEVRDDGFYDFTCDMGHKTLTKVQEQPFEILYEIGANAILDGYYREGVSSFAASLERFYEFAFLALGLHAGHRLDLLEKAWSPLKASSERQLGAFVALWTTVLGTVPKLLPDGKAGREFRNDVIHKGKIPSRDEATKFGDVVLNLLRDQVQELRNKCKESVERLVALRLERMPAKPGAESAGTTSISTIVSLNAEGMYDDDLERHLKLLIVKRRAYDNAGKSAGKSPKQ